MLMEGLAMVKLYSSQGVDNGHLSGLGIDLQPTDRQGTTIYKGHKNYELMFNLHLGISCDVLMVVMNLLCNSRHSVGKATPTRSLSLKPLLLQHLLPKLTHSNVPVIESHEGPLDVGTGYEHNRSSNVGTGYQRNTTASQVHSHLNVPVIGSHEGLLDVRTGYQHSSSSTCRQWSSRIGARPRRGCSLS